MRKPSSGDDGSVIDLKCKECDHHVRFNKAKPPIPGFVAVAKPTGLTTVYLTCDNPTTPHTNAYKINL
jgi:hypothetical protein